MLKQEFNVCTMFKSCVRIVPESVLALFTVTCCKELNLTINFFLRELFFVSDIYLTYYLLVKRVELVFYSHQNTAVRMRQLRIIFLLILKLFFRNLQ